MGTLDKVLAVDTWASGYDCNFDDAEERICPHCILREIAQLTGNPPAPPEVTLAAHNEAVAFRDEAAEHGFAMNFGVPGKEAGSSKILREVLQCTATPPRKIYPRRGDRVSITTNGSMLKKLKPLFLEYPLDILRVSGQTESGEVPLHQGSNLRAALENAVAIKEERGCREIQLSSIFLANEKGTNIEALLEQYYFFRQIVPIESGPFCVSDILHFEDGHYQSRATSQQIDDLVEAFVAAFPRRHDEFVALGEHLGPIVLELQWDQYLRVADVPELPLEPVSLSTNMLSAPGIHSQVNIFTVNPRCPHYLGIFQDGQIIQACDIKRPRIGSAGRFYTPGEVTKALREIVRGDIIIKEERW